MSENGNNFQQKIDELEAEIQRLKRTNKEFRESKSTGFDYVLNRICSSLSVGYFIFDLLKQELQFNHTLESLFENCLPSFPFTPNDLIEHANLDDRDFLKELFSEPKALKNKVNGQFRLSYRSKESRELRTFQVSGSYNKMDNGQLILLCIIRDITKENKQLRDIQRSLEKAEESDRIKTIFLLNISHNIRTPMNSILGFAELLHLTHPDSQQREEYIHTIKYQSKNLLQLIDDVSEIANYESGALTITKTTVNINFLLNEIIRDVECLRSTTRKENVGILYTPPATEGVEMFTDAGRLYQIFINIINHSLKFTSKGSIELGYLMPNENRINFFVKDTSEDLDKSELKKLFEKYTKIPEDESNRYDDETRLNLTIARSIVKLLGGKISYDYESGIGTTFNFSLPWEPPPNSTIEITEEELAFQQKYKWNDKVILIVEDEEVNGIFLEAVLHETGAQTIYAKNGYQAIDLCRSINKIDLILMDIRMPVMNGLKATEEIRKFNETIPIIAQTALALEEDHEQCLLAGCNDTITKPIEIEELLQLINRYFSH